MFPPITNTDGDVLVCLNCGKVMDFDGDFCTEACQLEYLAVNESTHNSDDFQLDSLDE